MSLGSLDEAIAWVRDRWQLQRTPPTRLHSRETEGVGLFYSPRFGHSLDAPIDAHSSISGTVNCYHPLIAARMSPHDCPECLGMGIKQHRSERYLWPMSFALTRLHASLGAGNQVHPYALVIYLAEHDWDARATAASMELDYGQASVLFLVALRRLHGFYAEGPTPTRTTTWIQKSDSQRAAETAA